MFELRKSYPCQAIQPDPAGKVIQCGQLGNSPHKFVWYNKVTKS
jgi:hypothetical protein